MGHFGLFFNLIPAALSRFKMADMGNQEIDILQSS